MEFAFLIFVAITFPSVSLTNAKQFTLDDGEGARVSCPQGGHNSGNLTLTAEPNRSYAVVCEALEWPSSNNPAAFVRSQGNDRGSW